MYAYIIFYILFHYSLSRDIEHSSLYYTIGSSLSILYVILQFAFANPKFPILPSLTPRPLGNRNSVRYVSNVFLFCFVDGFTCVIS